MTATSNINTTLIDATFPIANKSQSSQGFRTNWTAIQNNFNYAKSDILNLQNKTLNVTGDIIGTSSIFDSGSSPVTMSVTLEPTGLDNLNPGTYTSSLTNNITFTVDNRGLIVNLTEETAEPTMSGSGNIISETSSDKTKLYNGITSLNIPTISYNSYGQITGVTDNIITGFGMTNLYMPKNSLLYGNSTNVSSFLTPPSENSFLYYNGNELYWQASYPINSFINGNMANINYNTSNYSLELSVDYSTLTINNTYNGDNMIALYDGTNYTMSTLSTIQNSITDNLSSTIKIVNDTSPELGGNLDLNGYILTNNKNDIIQLQSTNINLVGSSSIKLNDLSFPVTNPTSTSFFSIGLDGSITYTPITDYIETKEFNLLNELTTMTLTKNEAVQLLSETSLNYLLISNSTIANSITIVADNTNYNSNTNYVLKYNVYIEVTNTDLTVNLSSTNSETIYLNGASSITSMTLNSGYIYKLEFEYYSNSKWLLNTIVKTTIAT